jgi:hypothetical protein
LYTTGSEIFCAFSADTFCSNKKTNKVFHAMAIRRPRPVPRSEATGSYSPGSVTRRIASAAPAGLLSPLFAHPG